MILEIAYPIPPIPSAVTGLTHKMLRKQGLCQQEACQAGPDGGWFEVGFLSAVVASAEKNPTGILTASTYPQDYV